MNEENMTEDLEAHARADGLLAEIAYQNRRSTMSLEKKKVPTLIIAEHNISIADTGDYDGVIYVTTSDGKVVFQVFNPDEEQENLVRHFVSVCNAHEDLVDAMQNFISGCSTSAITSEYWETFANLIAQSEIAIAKANRENTYE